MAFTDPPTVVAGQKVTASDGNQWAAGIDELQEMESSGEQGPDSAGPTSGTTPLTVDTATFTAAEVAGRLHVWANLTITKTVSTDRFTVDLEIGGATVCATTEDNAGGHTVCALHASGQALVAINTAATINVILTRASGSGTATVSAGTACILHWIFIPAP